MSTPMSNAGQPAFYTVREAAQVVRVNPSTLYRAIREGVFPAVRVRTRYVVPAAALDRLIAEATESGGCVDPARIVAERRQAQDVARVMGGAS